MKKLAPAKKPAPSSVALLLLKKIPSLFESEQKREFRRWKNYVASSGR